MALPKPLAVCQRREREQPTTLSSSGAPLRIKARELLNCIAVRHKHETVAIVCVSFHRRLFPQRSVSFVIFEHGLICERRRCRGRNETPALQRLQVSQTIADRTETTQTSREFAPTPEHQHQERAEAVAVLPSEKIPSRRNFRYRFFQQFVAWNLGNLLQDLAQRCAEVCGNRIIVSMRAAFRFRNDLRPPLPASTNPARSV